MVLLPGGWSCGSVNHSYLPGSQPCTGWNQIHCTLCTVSFTLNYAFHFYLVLERIELEGDDWLFMMVLYRFWWHYVKKVFDQVFATHFISQSVINHTQHVKIRLHEHGDPSSFFFKQFIFKKQWFFFILLNYYCWSNLAKWENLKLQTAWVTFTVHEAIR